jgi:hypothetical protein
MFWTGSIVIEEVPAIVFCGPWPARIVKSLKDVISSNFAVGVRGRSGGLNDDMVEREEEYCKWAH